MIVYIDAAQQNYHKGSDMRPFKPRYLQTFHEQVCHDPVTAITSAIGLASSFIGQRSADKKQKKAAQAQENAIREREAAANSAQRDQLREGRNRRGSGDFNVLGAVLDGSNKDAGFAPLRRITGAN